LCDKFNKLQLIAHRSTSNQQAVVANNRFRDYRGRGKGLMQDGDEAGIIESDEPVVRTIGMNMECRHRV
jgi:hypothetical protein